MNRVGTTERSRSSHFLSLRRDRAQSETIGVILLLGVVILTIGGFGVYYLGFVSDQASDDPRTDIRVEATGENVTVIHNGGDTLERQALDVIVENETGRHRISLAGATEVVGNGDDRFEPGEKWRVDSGTKAGETVSVSLVDKPSNSVVSTRDVNVATETLTPGDTTDPSVTLSDPNGGETFTGGQTTTITWTASDSGTGVSTVDLEYSTDDGDSWSTIESSVTNDGSYEWTVPSDDVTDALVRVTASDGAGNSASDQSDTSFTIDSTGPGVTSVTVDDAPIDDGDTGSPKTVTVFFDEAMDQTNDPNVRITGLARTYSVSPTNGGFQSGTKWTGEVTFRDDNEDATGTIEISSATDKAGNSLPTNDSATVEVKTGSSGPSLTGVRVQDNTKFNTGRFNVSYDVSDTANFDRVEITFDNRVKNWADKTIESTDSRTVLTYTDDGVEGDTYDITLRVYDTNGAVTDTRTVTDVADGTNPSGNDDLSRPNSPEFAGTVVDDVSGSEADYEVSYNVTKRTNFGQVRVIIENQDSGGADATYTSTDPRNNVDEYVSKSSGGTLGDSYRITVQLIDTDGIVVDERIVTDPADGDDPTGNADLSRPTSPTLTSWSLKDKTKNNNGDYQASFKVDDPNGEFQRVEVIFRNTDSSYASTTKSSTKRNNNVKYSQGGVEGDTYEIVYQVIDIDGIVVDEKTITDVADGTNP